MTFLSIMILILKLIRISKRGPGSALWAYIHEAIKLLTAKSRSHHHGVISDVSHDHIKIVRLHFIRGAVVGFIDDWANISPGSNGVMKSKSSIFGYKRLFINTNEI